MNVYLRDAYLTGPEAGTDFYVGPFPMEEAAEYHQKWCGPVKATIVRLDEKPEQVMTPGEHVDYLNDRW